MHMELLESDWDNMVNVLDQVDPLLVAELTTPPLAIVEDHDMIEHPETAECFYW